VRWSPGLTKTLSSTALGKCDTRYERVVAYHRMARRVVEPWNYRFAESMSGIVSVQHRYSDQGGMQGTFRLGKPSKDQFLL
jgi:hypothetical protein